MRILIGVRFLYPKVFI